MTINLPRYSKATTSSAGNHSHTTGQAGYNFMTSIGTYSYGGGGSSAPPHHLLQGERCQMELIITRLLLAVNRIRMMPTAAGSIRTRYQSNPLVQ